MLTLRHSRSTEAACGLLELADEHLLSDAERERACATLADAFAQGRLSAAEHGARVKYALGARRAVELAPVLEGLPEATSARGRARVSSRALLACEPLLSSAPTPGFASATLMQSEHVVISMDYQALITPNDGRKGFWLERTAYFALGRTEGKTVFLVQYTNRENHYYAYNYADKNLRTALRTFNALTAPDRSRRRARLRSPRLLTASDVHDAVLRYAGRALTKNAGLTAFPDGFVVRPACVAAEPPRFPWQRETHNHRARCTAREPWCPRENPGLLAWM